MQDCVILLPVPCLCLIECRAGLRKLSETSACLIEFLISLCKTEPNKRLTTGAVIEGRTRHACYSSPRKQVHRLFFASGSGKDRDVSQHIVSTSRNERR